MQPGDRIQKSAAGRAAVAERSQDLPGQLRTLLLMIYGDKTAAEYAEIASRLPAGAEGLRQLFTLGLVELVPTPGAAAIAETASSSPAPAPAPAPAPVQAARPAPLLSPAGPPTISPASGPRTVSPALGPATVSPALGPRTISPVSAPPTISPALAPRTISPTSGPPTISPASGPRTISPTSGPPATSPSAGPRTVDDASRFRLVRPEFALAISDLGLRGVMLQTQLERATTVASLLEMRQEIENSLIKTKGKKAKVEFAKRVDAALAQ